MAASLVDLLLAAAARDPDKMALRRQRAAWTYGDLTRGAAAASAALRVAGLEPGDRVGLLFRNSPEYVAFLYGALAARLAVVPLNVQERAGVLALQVAHSGARMVVGDPDHPEWQATSSGVAGGASDAVSAVPRQHRVGDCVPATARCSGHRGAARGAARSPATTWRYCSTPPAPRAGRRASC